MFILGLCIGSFLNVVAYRVPKKLPIIHDRSKCPSCDHALGVRDLIPLFSWLALRGKCRYCKAPIHWRYPLVELITGIAFVTICYHFDFGWETPAFLVFVCALIAISSVDFELYIIPNRIVYPAGFICLALLTLAAWGTGNWHSLKTALLSAVGCWLFMLVVHLISPKGMGFGDVRLSALIGLLLGWISPARAIAALIYGFGLGAIVGIVLMLLSRASRKTAIPFGPFLAMGAYLAIFVQLFASTETMLK